MGAIVSSIFQIGAGNVKAEQAQAQIESGAAATRASSYSIMGQAEASDYNASIAQNNAQLTDEQYAEQERRYRQAASEEVAKTTVGFAGNGIALTGTALNVIANNAANAELNALTIRNEGMIKAAAYTNASTLDQFQASQARTQAGFVAQQANYQESLAPLAGDSARLAGEAGAAGTLVTAASKLLPF